MPDLIAISCQRCQSRIDIPPDAALATCGRCGARLAVRRSDTAAWTEVIGDGEGAGEGVGEAEVGPSANVPREEYVSREEYEALKRRIDLEALERDALTQAGVAFAGRTGRLMAPMVPAAPDAQGDAAAPRWIDAGAMRRNVNLLGLLVLVPVVGCALNYAASLILNGNWVMGLLCLGGSAVFLSPAIIGLVLSHRRLNAYEAERRAYVLRRSAILAPDDQSAVDPAAADSAAADSAAGSRSDIA